MDGTTMLSTSRRTVVGRTKPFPLAGRVVGTEVGLRPEHCHRGGSSAAFQIFRWPSVVPEAGWHTSKEHLKTIHPSDTAHK
jgi:hypothetical protein